MLVSSCPRGIDWLRGNVQALPMMTKRHGVSGTRGHRRSLRGTTSSQSGRPTPSQSRRWCSPKGVLSQQSLLFASPPTARHGSIPLFSGFSCCVASSFHFICLHACAGVAVSLTFLATTGPHVPRQECWDVEVSQLRVQRPAFAAKVEVV